MTTLPIVGLYISTEIVEEMRIYVESAYGDNPAEFYLVEAIDEASKIDSSAMGVEWIQLSGNPYLKNMIWSFKK